MRRRLFVVGAAVQPILVRAQTTFAHPEITMKVGVPGSQPNPISFDFERFGIDANGVGEASTGKVQFNINSDRGITGPKVLAVWGKYSAAAEVTVASGYRLLDGTAEVDQFDIYTDTIPPAPKSLKPPAGDIQKHVPISFQRNTTNSGVFRITQTNRSMTGTIMVYFTVRYRPVT
jgi:hypothetical protein